MAKAKEQVEVVEKIPCKTDVEWTDYVIGHLDESEMSDGCPKTDGLRRLVEKFIGDIVDCNTVCIQPATTDNFNRATVQSSVTISTPDNKTLRYQCVADSCSRNTDPPYNQYPPQVAETRALGRCYRLALRLKGVIALEEKSDNAENVPDDIDENLKISDAQILGINNLCKSLNINIVKFINRGQTQYNSIKDIPLSKATKILRTLNEYRGGSRKILDEMLGYDASWREVFSK